MCFGWKLRETNERANSTAHAVFETVSRGGDQKQLFPQRRSIIGITVLIAIITLKILCVLLFPPKGVHG